MIALVALVQLVVVNANQATASFEDQTVTDLGVDDAVLEFLGGVEWINCIDATKRATIEPILSNAIINQHTTGDFLKGTTCRVVGFESRFAGNTEEVSV